MACNKKLDGLKGVMINLKILNLILVNQIKGK